MNRTTFACPARNRRMPFTPYFPSNRKSLSSLCLWWLFAVNRSRVRICKLDSIEVFRQVILDVVCLFEFFTKVNRLYTERPHKN